MHSCCRALPFLPCLCTSALGAQLVVNGTFDAGLSGWTSNGSVIVTSGFALLEETQPGATSALFQTVGGGTDPLLVEFSLFVNGMSSLVPSGSLADSAFGTIYLGDLAFGNDATAGVFEEQLSLFDLDHTGLAPGPGVTVENLAARPGWARFTIPLSTSRSFVTLVIEEVDLNLTPGDSVVALDDVSVTVIPEPSGPLLLLFAIGLFTAKRTRPT